VWIDRETRAGRRRWIERRRRGRNNRRWWTWRRKRRCGGVDRRSRRRRRRRRLRAESRVVSRLRARHGRLLRGRMSRRCLPTSGWRGGHGRRIRDGRCWRRVWLQRPRRRIGWDGRVRAVRYARMHERRALRATELWRHGSALQSAPRWRPVSVRMDLSVFLQHFTHTGARLRGAVVHPSRSFLHHAARVVRRHGHLRVPPDKCLPERRRMRPHQRRRSPVSVGLTTSEQERVAAGVARRDGYAGRVCRRRNAISGVRRC
jgi:hypothetical protein